MISLIAFGTLAFGGGPFKINGVNVPAKDLSHSGQVTYRAALASINGGRVGLKPERQHAVDNILSASGTVILALVDNSWTDTVAFTFGLMKLTRKLDTWYLVNTTDSQWRQINLGVVPKGGPLNLALVEDGANAHVYFNGKDLGATPYDSHSSQVVGIGSPVGEPNPWQGEVRDFEVLARQLTASDLTARFASFVPAETSAQVTEPATNIAQNPSSTIPTPTNPAPTNPIPTNPPAVNPTPPPTQTPTQTPAPVPASKSTVIVADVTAISEVPDPKSVLPYRHALVTEAFKVYEVKSGHIDKVDKDKIIHVARWGIVNSQKTDVANVKVGDRIELTLELFADHSDLANYYTIDTLPEDFTAPYLLDTGRKAPGGGGG